MKVRCIDAKYSTLVKDEIYEVEREYNNFGRPFYDVIRKDGRDGKGWYQSRFEIIKEEETGMKIGDRVMVTKGYDSAMRGMEGTIVVLEDDRLVLHPRLGVRMDKEFCGGHDLMQGGHKYCADGYGQWIPESNLEVIIKEEVLMEKVTVAGKVYFVTGTGDNGELILKPAKDEETNKKFDDKFTADKVMYDAEAKTVTVEYTSDFDKTKPPVTKTQTYVFQKGEIFNREVGFEICAIKARLEIWEDRLVRAGKKIAKLG